MNITYRGFAVVPKYDMRYDSCPVGTVYSTFLEAQHNLSNYTKEGVVVRVEVSISPIKDEDYVIMDESGDVSDETYQKLGIDIKSD